MVGRDKFQPILPKGSVSIFRVISVSMKPTDDGIDVDVFVRIVDSHLSVSGC